jgi:hypothetical protein
MSSWVVQLASAALVAAILRTPCADFSMPAALAALLNALPKLSLLLNGRPLFLTMNATVHGSVNYDTNDKLCMEGLRLIYVSGGSGSDTDGAIYHTEVESFSQILENNALNASNAWFEVWTKSANTCSSATLYALPSSLGDLGAPRADN